MGGVGVPAGVGVPVTLLVAGQLADGKAAIEAQLLARLVATTAGCWEFSGCRRSGYGRIWINGRLRSAHRVAAWLWAGLDDLDDLGTKACHHCDNPPCCNPACLFLGTQADNMEDASQKGRLIGKRQGFHPLTYPRFRECVICGVTYEPDGDHRGRSRVCTQACARVRQAQNINAGRPTKLAPDDVRAIRAALATRPYRGAGKEIATEFGVACATISNIKTGKLWPNVR